MLDPKNMMRLKIRLTRPSTGRSLTLTGWLLVGCISAGLVMIWAHTIVDYLSYNRPLPDAKVLMVEGFLPDYALERAAKTFQRDGYKLLVTTGQPIIDQGQHLPEHASLADLAYASLKALRFDTSLMVSAPAPAVWRDRSVANARAAFAKLVALRVSPCRVNVISLSAHSRRSWLIYKEVGKEYGYDTGIIAEVDSTFDGRAWWKSSRGTRVVIAETLACYYVELFGLSD